MKKITLLAMLLFCTLAIAQEITIIERLSDSPTALISVEGDDGSGVYVADSFTLTEGFGLNSITFPGFYSNGSGVDATTAVNVIIYANSGDTPGNGFQPQITDTGVIELKGITSEHFTISGASQNQLFTVDLEGANGGESPTLVAGSYWMVFYPSVTGSPTAVGRWNWYMSSAANSFDALLIDPQNLFGADATNWTHVSNLIGDVGSSFAWTLKGSPALSVKENKVSKISVFPNPARDFVTLKIPSHIQVEQASLYSVLGKKINVTLANNRIDVAHLARGLYILNLESSAGTWTEKLIIE